MCISGINKINIVFFRIEFCGPLEVDDGARDIACGK